jgi:flavin reductase (DIM6/NTAB) family NADH-FMN oxidoreductase RutF
VFYFTWQWVGCRTVEEQRQGEPTPDRMREVLGTFATGVVVVTALADEPLGFTCQSFVSQSLDPPLISFSAARSSTTWPQIRAVGRFCVNVLAHDQHEVSELFAQSGADRFGAVSWRSSPLGAPILDGVSAWIDGEVAAELAAGDHTIVLGAVRALDMDPSRYPLIYYRSRYAPSAHWQVWTEID